MDALQAALFVAGLALLIAGGESLVHGAARLAGSLGISPVVAGLTVVAFGTSSPELAVAIGSAMAGEPDLVLGNVIGSNIYNVLLVLGIAAMIGPLVVQGELIRRDVPLMILASLATILLALDGSIGRWDGLLLFTALIVWIAWSIREGRRSEDPAPGSAGLDARDQRHLPPGSGGAWRSRLWSLAFVAAGLVLLVVGARWLVDGAVVLATSLGLSPLVVGLTVVALGTSLPEIATSVIASLRGQRDLAVGSIVGSNLFNLLAVLGLTALIAGDVPVPLGALTFDLPVMLAVAIACLPIFFTGYCIGRREGALFVAYAVGYTVYLLATAVEHPVVPALAEALFAVVIPLTMLTIGVLATRQYQQRRAVRDGRT